MNKVAEILAGELDRPAPDGARAVAAKIVERHGGSVAAILFYGSMLRNQGGAGIIDLYVLTDDLFRFHGDRLAAAANHVLPPNVAYVEAQGPDGIVRAKVAVMSLGSFVRRARGTGMDTTIWARFCQPAVLVHVRDQRTRKAVLIAVADCVDTALRWARRWAPNEASAALLWTRLFENTYAAELRAERSGRAAEIYQSSALRYDRLAEAEAEPEGGLHLPWPFYRVCGKALNILRLAKAAFTFSNGLDYLVWKIQRHAGRRVPISPWERRHPFLAAPGFLWRLYRDGLIR